MPDKTDETQERDGKLLHDTIHDLITLPQSNTYFNCALMRFVEFPEEGMASVIFAWNPGMFIRPMPIELRQKIIAGLRAHADLLESGELDDIMNRMTVQLLEIRNGESSIN